MSLVHGQLNEMGDLLVRNIDDALIHLLEQRAAAHRRSIEAEHRMILQEALLAEDGIFARRARRWRCRTAGRHATDSAELIRADRDRDHQT